MPLPLEQFILSPYYKQLTLASEDQPQDERDWKRMVREDQAKQYTHYLSQFESDELRNNKSALHNTESTLRKPNEKWNDYMKKYRKRDIQCPSCGHHFKQIKRVK